MPRLPVGKPQMKKRKNPFYKNPIVDRVRTVQPPTSLIEAISERKVVSFIYDGLSREVEPHACGVFSNGRTMLIGYQVGGASKSNEEPPWRNFSVEKIRSLRKTDAIFRYNRPEYNPHDDRMSPLFAKV
jgi:predicted DNA-binding transcriptional regulator YafY